REVDAHVRLHVETGSRRDRALEHDGGEDRQRDRGTEHDDREERGERLRGDAAQRIGERVQVEAKRAPHAASPAASAPAASATRRQPSRARLASSCVASSTVTPTWWNDANRSTIARA